MEHAHIRFQMAEPPYICECMKQFETLDDLEQHIKDQDE